MAGFPQGAEWQSTGPTRASQAHCSRGDPHSMSRHARCLPPPPTACRAWQAPYFGFQGEGLVPGNRSALMGRTFYPQRKHPGLCSQS